MDEMNQEPNAGGDSGERQDDSAQVDRFKQLEEKLNVSTERQAQLEKELEQERAERGNLKNQVGTLRWLLEQRPSGANPAPASKPKAEPSAFEALFGESESEPETPSPKKSEVPAEAAAPQSPSSAMIRMLFYTAYPDLKDISLDGEIYRAATKHMYEMSGEGREPLQEMPEWFERMAKEVRASKTYKALKAMEEAEKTRAEEEGKSRAKGTPEATATGSTGGRGQAAAPPTQPREDMEQRVREVFAQVYGPDYGTGKEFSAHTRNPIPEGPKRPQGNPPAGRK